MCACVCVYSSTVLVFIHGLSLFIYSMQRLFSC